jgi:hypothetical protein
MILVLSGEGPTDLGTRRPKGAGWEFVPGPMAWIVDKLLGISSKLNYSLLDLHANGADCICFLTETELSALRSPKPQRLRRREEASGSQYFRVGAFLLGNFAKGIASERNSPVIAVFFRDADGTRSAPRTEWTGKFTSMQEGFEASEFASGVPMVPRPKSEAWMLCGLLRREDAARDCIWLEEEAGNDASPHSLKARLARHLGYEPTAEQQVELVSSAQISPEQIDLPSFLAFREELDRAYANAAPPLQ